MAHYSIGIDTGGTYTDAVVIQRNHKPSSANVTRTASIKNTDRILASAKSLTTHGNLASGISDALAKVLSAATEKSKGDFKVSDVHRIVIITL